MSERVFDDTVSSQSLLDALHQPVVLIDQTAVIVASNRAWKAFCQDSAGFHGKNYLAVCSALGQHSQNALALCHQGFEDVLKGKRSLFQYDFSQHEHHYTMTATLLETMVMILHTDNTDLVQSNAQLTMLLEAPLDALMVIDHHGLIQMVNHHLEQMFGYTRDELFGQTLDILLPHRFRRQHRQHVSSFLEKPRTRPMGSGLELYGLRKDGTEFPVEISLNPIQSAGTPLVSAAIRDVSERKRSEAQLSRLARILESSSNEIYLFDATTLCFTFVNQGAIKNLGYSADELSVLTPLDLKPDFDVASFEELLRPLREGEKGALHFSTVHQRKDGSRYPVDVYLQFFRHETPPLFAAVITDTSERDATQRALRESQQRVAMHVANTPLAVLEWCTQDGLITAWNPAAERLFGFQAEEVIGKHSADIIIPEDLKAKLEPILRGNIHAKGLRSTHKNITKDGRILTCEWYNTLLNDDQGPRVAAMALDVTVRQRAINELLTVQEEERSRIARDLHDHVGQLLTGLNLGLSAAIEKPDASKLHNLKELASTILEDVRRISRDLRPALLDELGLESAIKHFTRELVSQSNVKVDVLMRIPDTVPRDVAIVIYRVTQEALTNVLRHAQAQHASVIITTSENLIHLIIEDDGIGFDPAAIISFEHVGLSSMRERIELVGGTFTIESLPRKGTTINAAIPFK